MLKESPPVDDPSPMRAVRPAFQARSVVELHIAVLLFGVAGLFGKLISVSPELIAFARTSIAAVVLLLVLRISGNRISVATRQDLLLTIASGLLLAGHWVSFFYAIQVSTVAIGLIGFAVFPVVVALLEPLLFDLKYRKVDVYCAAAVALGLLIVAPEFTFADVTTKGLIWAIFSGVLFALLTLANRQATKRNEFRVVALLQYVVATLLLLPLVVSNNEVAPAQTDFILLVILGLVFTALPHTLFIKALSKVKASFASVVVGLEPIYGIVLAAIVLHEYPAQKTLIGAVLVLGAVMVSSRAHREKT